MPSSETSRSPAPTEAPTFVSRMSPSATWPSVTRALGTSPLAVWARPAEFRSGGSIPVVGLFEKHAGIPSVLMGFGLPDDNLHAPNEKFHLPNFYKGIETVGRYLARLGED